MHSVALSLEARGLEPSSKPSRDLLAVACGFLSRAAGGHACSALLGFLHPCRRRPFAPDDDRMVETATLVVRSICYGRVSIIKCASATRICLIVVCVNSLAALSADVKSTSLDSGGRNLWRMGPTEARGDLLALMRFALGDGYPACRRDRGRNRR